MKFEILTNPYHFHIKYRLESTKKMLGYAQTKQIKIFKICQFGHFLPFSADFGIFPLKIIGFFIFFYTAANFTLMCLRNNNKKIWDQMFKNVLLVFKVSSRAVFDHFWPFFGSFGHISTKVHRNFYFLLHSYLFYMHEPQNQQKKSWE